MSSKFHTGKNLAQYAMAYSISSAPELGELKKIPLKNNNKEESIIKYRWIRYNINSSILVTLEAKCKYL